MKEKDAKTARIWPFIGKFRRKIPTSEVQYTGLVCDRLQNSRFFFFSKSVKKLVKGRVRVLPSRSTRPSFQTFWRRRRRRRRKISTSDHRYSQRAPLFYHRPRKAAKMYECAYCGPRFTQSCKLLHHAARCTNGQTKIVFRGEKIWAPESLYERTFHTRGKYGKRACYWVEIEARRHGIHISYQMCWHRDERLFFGHPVDGFHLESKAVLQFHECHFHGCPQCYPERDHVLHREKGKNVTREHV